MIINYEKKKIDVKICVLGIKGSGKTSFVKKLTEEMEIKIGAIYSPLIEVKHDTSIIECVSFFTFRKIKSPEAKNIEIKDDEKQKEDFLDIILTLQTVPENASKKTFFQGVDGAIFIVDSRLIKLYENEMFALDLFKSLREEGIRPEKIPFVFAYNFCDMKVGIIKAKNLNERFNAFKAPYLLMIAESGVGVVDVMKSISDLAIQKIPHEKFRAEEPQIVTNRKGKYSKGSKITQYMSVDQLRSDQEFRRLSSAKTQYRIRQRSDENVWRNLVNRVESDLDKDKK